MLGGRCPHPYRDNNIQSACRNAETLSSIAGSTQHHRAADPETPGHASHGTEVQCPPCPRRTLGTEGHTPPVPEPTYPGFEDLARDRSVGTPAIPGIKVPETALTAERGESNTLPALPPHADRQRGGTEASDAHK